MSTRSEGHESRWFFQYPGVQPALSLGIPGIETEVAFHENEASVASPPPGFGPPDRACTVICAAPAGTRTEMLVASHSSPLLLLR